MAQPVDQAFPHLAAWVTAHGWIEIGYTEDHLAVCASCAWLRHRSTPATGGA